MGWSGLPRNCALYNHNGIQSGVSRRGQDSYKCLLITEIIAVGTESENAPVVAATSGNRIWQHYIHRMYWIPAYCMYIYVWNVYNHTHIYVIHCSALRILEINPFFVCEDFNTNTGIGGGSSGCSWPFCKWVWQPYMQLCIVKTRTVHWRHVSAADSYEEMSGVGLSVNEFGKLVKGFPSDLFLCWAYIAWWWSKTLLHLQNRAKSIFSNRPVLQKASGTTVCSIFLFIKASYSFCES